LNLSTDASYRFERAVSWDGAAIAAARALNLILELAGGSFEARLDSTDLKFTPAKIRLRTARLLRVLGQSYAAGEIRSILEALGMNVSETDDGFDVLVPSWRHDIAQEIDLVEEIARINGYDSIPVTVPAVVPDIAEGKKALNAGTLITERLVSLGFCEAINYSFLEESRLAELNLASAERIANPLSKENEVLRTSILPGLVKNYFLNAYFGNKNLKLFESGKVFPKEGEKNSLGIIVSGELPSSQPFYFMKGVLSAVFDGNKITFEENARPYPFLHPGKSALIKLNGKDAGQFGIMISGSNGDINEAMLCCAELDMELIEKIWNRKTAGYKPLWHYPGVKRDLSLTADSGLPFGRISELLSEQLAKGGALSRFQLTDIYQDPAKLGPGKISYTLHLVFRNPERTLTDEEVNKALEETVRLMKEKLGVSLRS
jgi:phenylalanyl-tRNA synthetase beta chain